MIRYIPIQSISFKHIKPLVNLHALNNAYILTIVNVQKKIIGAHSIQNNKILKKISDNGEIYMPCPKADNPFLIPTK